MENWRHSLCGTIAMRSALKGGETSLDLNTLNGMSEHLSCGGMYIPNWQSRFEGSPVSRVEKAKKLEFLHTAPSEDGRVSLIMVGAAGESRPVSARPIAHTDFRGDVAQVPGAAEAVLQEIGEWWNKN